MLTYWFKNARYEFRAKKYQITITNVLYCVGKVYMSKEKDIVKCFYTAISIFSQRRAVCMIEL